MNIEQIVQTVMAILIPSFPYLLKGIKIVGEKAAEKIGEKSGEITIEQAENAWHTISKAKGKSADKVKKSAKSLAQTPQDADWQSMFKNSLTQLLQEDATLSQELSQILKIETSQQILQASGNEGAEIEQNMKGSGMQKATLKNNLDIRVKQSKK